MVIPRSISFVSQSHAVKNVSIYYHLCHTLPFEPVGSYTKKGGCRFHVRTYVHVRTRYIHKDINVFGLRTTTIPTPLTCFYCPLPLFGVVARVRASQYHPSYNNCMFIRVASSVSSVGLFSQPHLLRQELLAFILLLSTLLCFNSRSSWSSLFLTPTAYAVTFMQ